MADRIVGPLIRGCIACLGLFYGLAPVWLSRWVVGAGAALLSLWKPRIEVVRANLRRAFPGDERETVEKRERLEFLSYEHLLFLTFEIAMLFVPGRFLLKWAAKYQEVEGYENWEEAHRQGKGVLFLSSHVGNWELMSAVGGVRKIDLLLVTKRLKPAWFHWGIEQGRLRAHVKATYEPRTFRDVLPHLARGGTVGVVLDQYAGSPVGVRVPLFGTPVGTHQMLAVLARRTGAKVVPVLSYRRADGRYFIRVEKGLDWIEHENADEELALNTARYVQVMERHILECPEQWLWIHRRFKGDLSPLRAEEWREGRARK